MRKTAQCPDQSAEFGLALAYRVSKLQRSPAETPRQTHQPQVRSIELLERAPGSSCWGKAVASSLLCWGLDPSGFTWQIVASVTITLRPFPSLAAKPTH